MRRKDLGISDLVEDKFRAISEKLDNARKNNATFIKHCYDQNSDDDSKPSNLYDECQRKIKSRKHVYINRRSNKELYKKKTATFMDNYSEFRDSRVFLKGLTTQNIQNDFAQYFVDTGKRPHNYIRDTSVESRYNSYPKLKELIRLKDEVIDKRRTPAFYLKQDLRKFDLEKLSNKFDVILMDPPLNEYKKQHPIIHQNLDTWSWDELKQLNIDAVSSTKSFLFLWCGSREGLEKGRECLKKWGFRRCEDVCWVKTNKKYRSNPPNVVDGSLLQNLKEHLLMGIKGTVRRNTDVHLIHTNIDLDVVVSDEQPNGSLEKPKEIYRLIEHFCLSRKRLCLFGNQKSIRDGWVVVGKDLVCSNYTPDHYNSYFENDGVLIGSTPEIEQLRPKSPVQKRAPQIQLKPNSIHSNHLMFYRP